jgi:hypothetical protein
MQIQGTEAMSRQRGKASSSVTLSAFRMVLLGLHRSDNWQGTHCVFSFKNDNKKIAIYVDNNFIAKCGRVGIRVVLI